MLKKKIIDMVKRCQRLAFRTVLGTLLLISLAASVHAEWLVNTATITWVVNSTWTVYSNTVMTFVARESEEVEDSTFTVVTIGLDGGTVQLGSSTIVIPPGAIGTNINVSMERLAIARAPEGDGAAGTTSPVAFYRFKPDGTRFKKACTIKLAYADANNDGKVDNTNIDNTKLKVFWWDEFHWRLIGGVVDPETNTVSVKISHFSDYALFPVSALTDDAYRPKKTIITPYSDYKHCDRAYFDNLPSGTSIKIYDITGLKIRTVDTTFFTANGAYWWDGQDDDGDVVESGVYIYQFEIDGELISGTIAVAK